MRVGKRFRAADGSLRHLMHVVVRPDGCDVIVSKSWNRRKQSWSYFAETNQMVIFGMQMAKLLKK